MKKFLEILTHLTQ